MRIIEPSVKVLAYTQLVPTHVQLRDEVRGIVLGEESSESSFALKYVPQDPCSEMARVVERCGRVSWKSEDKMGPGTADGFCTRVVNIRKDESIAEHASATMLLVTDRYVTHQLVRHRIGAYTQESTHYINYGKKGDEIEVCRPMGIKRFEDGDPDKETSEFYLWRRSCEMAEANYMTLLAKGVKHYHARYVLPSCLKTEIAVTYNLRMWRHVLAQRVTPNNTPEISFVMKKAGQVLAALCPEMFAEYKQAT